MLSSLRCFLLCVVLLSLMLLPLYQFRIIPIIGLDIPLLIHSYIVWMKNFDENFLVGIGINSSFKVYTNFNKTAPLFFLLENALNLNINFEAL